ncbi:hypothetical protein O181_127008, partial [Austropuccinia psidii MF-1]|nr:hypothetical protein [Austropuccinia psidii MF-1]
MAKGKWKFLTLLLNVLPRVRIAFKTTILALQSAITASLERNHVVVLGCTLPT